MNPDAHREKVKVVMFGKMAAVRELLPVRLLPEYPCEAARFELRFTLEKVKYPAASNGVFDPRGSRQISMQAWLLGSLLAEIKKKRKSISSRGSEPAADEEAEYGK